MTDQAAAAAGPDPGNGKAPTIAEVASLAGVSIATVSRVVSGTRRVGDATRLRVEQAIAATGWSANPAARLLAGGPGDEVVLALAVASPQEFAGDPYYARVVAGAQAEAAQLGLSLSVHVTRVGSVPGLPPFGRKRHHIGAVLVNVNPWEAADVHELGWPVVSLGATTPHLPSVDPENEAGAAGAVRHLLTRGRRRIATIAGPDRNPCARERLAGYRSAVRAAGLPETGGQHGLHPAGLPQRPPAACWTSALTWMRSSSPRISWPRRYFRSWPWPGAGSPGTSR